MLGDVERTTVVSECDDSAACLCRGRGLARGRDQNLRNGVVVRSRTMPLSSSNFGYKRMGTRSQERALRLRTFLTQAFSSPTSPRLSSSCCCYSLQYDDTRSETVRGETNVRWRWSSKRGMKSLSLPSQHTTTFPAVTATQSLVLCETQDWTNCSRNFRQLATMDPYMMSQRKRLGERKV